MVCDSVALWSLMGTGIYPRRSVPFQMERMDPDAVPACPSGRTGRESLPMRRLAVAALALLVVVRSAAARSRTYASSCRNLRVRPHGIVLTCADANFQLRHLHWRRWGGHRAFGRG